MVERLDQRVGDVLAESVCHAQGQKHIKMVPIGPFGLLTPSRQAGSNRPA
jgi:hypothetical protein